MPRPEHRRFSTKKKSHMLLGTHTLGSAFGYRRPVHSIEKTAMTTTDATLLTDGDSTTNRTDDQPELGSAEERRAVLKHRRGSRWTHWINFPLLTIMIYSGLRIYWADLRDPVGIGIGGWHWFDLFPDRVNETLGLERKLARGLAFHLTFGWIFAINGFAYTVYTLATREWKHLKPGKGSLKDSLGVVLHDLHIRKEAPAHAGRYNAAQRISYSLIIFFGLVALVTGFAIYKPTQLSLLTNALGGYEVARKIHFFVTMAFIGFFVVHILQVAKAGFGNFTSMITGYQLEDKPTSPTSKNANKSQNESHEV